MTLSLINLNSGEEQENASTENDSPIGEDIEIINGAEKESNDTDESDQKESDEVRIKWYIIINPVSTTLFPHLQAKKVNWLSPTFHTESSKPNAMQD